MSNEVSDFIRGVVQGTRATLARAITLAESEREKDARFIGAVLQALPPVKKPSARIGVTGPGGVGKSTFISALGRVILAEGKSLAVLTVDPSSPTSGGSLLGDKVRMPGLSGHERAFVRTSPGGRGSGGISKGINASLRVLDAAGFDVLIVETIGSGQSEYLVRGLVDTFVVLQQAGLGDDLQVAKRGALDLADAVIYTKCENDPGLTATAIAQARSSYRLRHTSGSTIVAGVDSVTGIGIEELWKQLQSKFSPAVREFKTAASGDISTARVQWLRGFFLGEIERKMSGAEIEKRIDEMATEVLSHRLKFEDACVRLFATLDEETGGERRPRDDSL